MGIPEQTPFAQPVKEENEQLEKIANSPVSVSDKRFRLFGYATIFVTFGLFGGWAAFAPLDSAASAQGVVTVKSSRKSVQHLEGGIVKELLVRDGDHVQRGQPLLVLDTTQIQSEYEIVKSQIIAIQAAISRLQAERDSLDNVTYKDVIEPGSERTLAVEANELGLFRARKASRLGQVSVLSEKNSQLQQQIIGLRKVIQTKQLLVSSYSKEIGELQELLKQGYVDKQRLTELQRDRDSLLSQLAEHQSDITRTELQISENKLQILQVQKDFSSDVVRQLSENLPKMLDLKARLTALEDRSERTVIRSPDDGIVMDMTVHTIGGVVRPATPIMEIVPDNSDLVIEARLKPNDIDRVRPGKYAEVRFNTFHNPHTLVVDGEVAKVSADRLSDERTGEPYYKAQVVLTEEGRKQMGPNKMVPGMPADVLINTGSRTMLQYLLQPATDAIAHSLIEE
ncbi:HlyD family type I secretion periplasmic adaptor subunit [Pseudomonas benzopyrenica]|uniref:Membrane fusion protein (MFP) family protein n=1 Tax=Pseudomonas benzopyrenica TaxID=2993566 RepID=A0ABZ2FQ69_9PSED